MTVPSSLIKRSRSHFLTINENVQVIIGMNGVIWVGLLEDYNINSKDQNEEVLDYCLEYLESKV